MTSDSAVFIGGCGGPQRCHGRLRSNGSATRKRVPATAVAGPEPAFSCGRVQATGAACMRSKRVYPGRSARGGPLDRYGCGDRALRDMRRCACGDGGAAALAPMGVHQLRLQPGLQLLPGLLQPDRAHGAAMPLETFRRVVDEARELGCTEVFLTGGEPAIVPHLPEMIAYATPSMRTTRADQRHAVAGRPAGAAGGGQPPQPYACRSAWIAAHPTCTTTTAAPAPGRRRWRGSGCCASGASGCAPAPPRPCTRAAGCRS